MIRSRGLALSVVADDRTGAMETAGECADAGLGPVLVSTTLGDRPARRGRCVVVDLDTRHLDVEAAQRAVAAADGVGAHRHAHKIDSGLRGNWAAELVARHGSSGWRVLVVPANPQVGRTCVEGVVLLDGRPVEEATGDDALDPVTSSRPADHLVAAGAPEVAELRSAVDVAHWLSTPGPAFAVCDAETDLDLEALGDRWALADEVLFAGSAASIGRAAGTVGGSRTFTSRPRPPGPCLVVCGSVNRASQRQLDALAASGATVGVVGDPSAARLLLLEITAHRPGVLRTPVPGALPVDPPAAASMAAELADVAARLWDVIDPGVVIVIGGDTAAAVLGDRPLVVFATIAPGTPIGVVSGSDRPLIVTRSGAFGDDDALVDLLRRLGPEVP